MKYKLTMEQEYFFKEKLKAVCRNSRFLETQQYIQHGKTSVFRHSVSVAYVSYCLTLRWRLKVDKAALIRGALLHDYFLYDWHIKDKSHKWHGYQHAETAWKNAMKEFQLNKIEQNMIRCHMFPLNLTKIPKYKESWILCYADKVCSGSETAKGVLEKIGIFL